MARACVVRATVRAWGGPAGLVYLQYEYSPAIALAGRARRTAERVQEDESGEGSDDTRLKRHAALTRAAAS